ncbi:MAG: RsmF rRNA methyltransferase first C-terminal domain-containing protein [Lachnospiraceae bacterium]|nr:RsmF rRNA methyltransferase first C-terminal domain-containing protein [Lachnospiraceae bacterium]
MQLPIEFINRMKDELKEAFDAFISSYDDAPRTALRINPLKRPVLNADALKAAFPGGTFTPVSYERNGYVYSGDIAPGKHPLHAAGAYYIQEPSAMSPVAVLSPSPGDRVLDLCAAPGGKSTQIAGLMKNEGILVSNEPVSSRAKILSENMERLCVRNSIVTNEMPDRLAGFFPGYFNKILVDAPCSGEGMFRKSEEALTEWSPENVTSCALRQKNILKSALEMLCPGGMLCYSTCTFAPEEDEENVEWLLENYPDLSLIEKNKIYPHTSEGEGHFYALFKRDGDEADALLPRKSISVRPLSKCKAWTEFAKDMGLELKGVYTAFGNDINLVPEDFPAVDKLKVLRIGLHLGTLKGDLFIPSHALALCLSPSEVKRSCDLSPDEETVSAYLRGETFSHNGEKGWTLISVSSLSLGWGKLSNNTMKNHYPKGLRTHGH